MKYKRSGSKMEDVTYNIPDFPVYLCWGEFAPHTCYRILSHWHDDLEFLYMASGQLFYNINDQRVRLKAGGHLCQWAAAPFHLQRGRLGLCLPLFAVPSHPALFLPLGGAEVCAARAGKSGPAFSGPSAGGPAAARGAGRAGGTVPAPGQPAVPAGSRAPDPPHLGAGVPVVGPAAQRRAAPAGHPAPDGPEGDAPLYLRALRRKADPGADQPGRPYRQDHLLRHLPAVYRGVAHLLPDRLPAEKALELLEGTDQTVAEISFAAGFSSASYFAGIFRKCYGCTPTEYRARLQEDAPFPEACKSPRQQV